MQDCILYKLTVFTKTLSYPIIIGENFLYIYKEFLDNYNNIIIITSDVIIKYYKNYIDQIRELTPNVSFLLIKDGEKYKNLNTLNYIYKNLVKKKINRNSLIIAFGGGVIGDIVGFASATYMRGLDIIHIPTTLLAMVDSSIGGKTAINLSEGKNLIGAFHHPNAIFCNLKFLNTLPVRVFNASIMEVIIRGLILDADFYDYIFQNKEYIKEKKKETISYLIYHGCKLKAGIVEKDEKEKGIRRILNFGHTIGHALESYTNYEFYLHGEAIALGSLVIIKYLVDKKVLSLKFFKNFIDLLNYFQLPTSIPNHFIINEIMDRLQYDKKNRDEKHQWVLLKCIGEANFDQIIAQKDIEIILTNLKTS